ncbi:glycosyltransferase family 2 protein [Paralcaligenes ureilyticus]|uniref:GT2 family glycosyltransferase n=1 Tax=Paralcaligenes ureilyticus TaxID=627131 RepID=A0A4R3MAK1_9BURK|nr:glycosyltransferase [Paralcaligenes ureilyticus]TCT10162.1 GT2 family glycosyltransferase [Paralcaligenes ureilyticus]
MENFAKERAMILVLTRNHRAQLLNTLESLRQMPGRWPIIVVDNGSSDGTAAAVASRFPKAMLIRATRDLGAAARNIGVAYVHTPYVAFCDDDTQWEPGALDRAADLLDAAPDVAVLSACVQMGATREPNPLCSSMMHSPLAREHLPGPQLLGFMAGACVMRTRAFYDVGGYWPPFFLGGEEALMALDLAARGWRIIYADDVVARHFPASELDTRQRQYLLIRNAIWLAWMRWPLRAAWRETHIQFTQAHRCRIFGRVLLQVLLGLPRALRRRKVISPAIEAMRVQSDHAAVPPLISPGY